ncbi:hypothetical protein M427DRAFT_29817 [Gonapodya prolifera JEL478]|uniref:Endonuclease/exonuclease/phosphatase domain-containing protein n=1 Tax=Gonapodya prolifera (strain JEL478) TaxID=1344416 RepID=A0A139AP72_GONPJ|nr:hypothetical protein M427DRAFT_29817 [Gonapodya prolifera JEL478]|eukprot:KXS18540.1 hypothetical protein M427DRAFT_29817 [Gonapodya prolifera JEL478]
MDGGTDPGNHRFELPSGEGEKEDRSEDNLFIRDDVEMDGDDRERHPDESAPKTVAKSPAEQKFLNLEKEIFMQNWEVLITSRARRCDLKGCGKAARLKEVLGATPGCSAALTRWEEGFKSLTGGEPGQMNRGKTSDTGSRAGMKAGGSKPKSTAGQVQGNTLDQWAIRPPPTSTSISGTPVVQSTTTATTTATATASGTALTTATTSWADKVKEGDLQECRRAAAQPACQHPQQLDGEVARLLTLLEAANQRQAELRELRRQVKRLTAKLVSERLASKRAALETTGKGVGGRHVPGAGGVGKANVSNTNSAAAGATAAPRPPPEVKELGAWGGSAGTGLQVQQSGGFGSGGGSSAPPHCPGPNPSSSGPRQPPQHPRERSGAPVGRAQFFLEAPSTNLGTGLTQGPGGAPRQLADGPSHSPLTPTIDSTLAPALDDFIPVNGAQKRKRTGGNRKGGEPRGRGKQVSQNTTQNGENKRNPPRERAGRGSYADAARLGNPVTTEPNRRKRRETDFVRPSRIAAMFQDRPAARTFERVFLRPRNPMPLIDASLSERRKRIAGLVREMGIREEVVAAVMIPGGTVEMIVETKGVEAVFEAARKLRLEVDDKADPFAPPKFTRQTPEQARTITARRTADLCQMSRSRKFQETILAGRNRGEGPWGRRTNGPRRQGHGNFKHGRSPRMKFLMANVNRLAGKAAAVREAAREHHIDVSLLCETWLSPSSNPPFGRHISNITNEKSGYCAGGRKNNRGLLATAWNPGADGASRELAVELGGRAVVLDCNGTIVIFAYIAPSDNNLLVGDLELTGDLATNRRGEMLEEALDHAGLTVMCPSVGKWTSFGRNGRRGIPDVVIANLPIADLVVHETETLGGSDHACLTFSVDRGPDLVDKQVRRWNIRKLERPRAKKKFIEALEANAKLSELKARCEAVEWALGRAGAAADPQPFVYKLADTLYTAIRDAAVESIGYLHWTNRVVDDFEDDARLAQDRRAFQGAAKKAWTYRAGALKKRTSLFQSYFNNLASGNKSGFLRAVKGIKKRRDKSGCALDPSKMADHLAYFKTTWGGPSTGLPPDIQQPPRLVPDPPLNNLIN